MPRDMEKKIIFIIFWPRWEWIEALRHPRLRLRIYSIYYRGFITIVKRFFCFFSKKLVESLKERF